MNVASLIVSILGLIVSSIGFWKTVEQIRRTATASEAANKTFEDVGRRMNSHHILLLAPQINQICDDLDAAISNDDVKDASRLLVAYARSASTVSAAISLTGEAEKLGTFELGMIEKLNSSAEMAGAKKGELYNVKGTPLDILLKEVSGTITQVSIELVKLTANYRAKVS